MASARSRRLRTISLDCLWDMQCFVRRGRATIYSVHHDLPSEWRSSVRGWNRNASLQYQRLCAGFFSLSVALDASSIDGCFRGLRRGGYMLACRAGRLARGTSRRYSRVPRCTEHLQIHLYCGCCRPGSARVDRWFAVSEELFFCFLFLGRPRAEKAVN